MTHNFDFCSKIFYDLHHRTLHVRQANLAAVAKTCLRSSNSLVFSQSENQPQG